MQMWPQKVIKQIQFNNENIYVYMVRVQWNKPLNLFKIWLNKNSWKITQLTHCPWWYHIMIYIWISIGSDTGLLPDGIKPLSEQVLTYRQIIVFSGVHLSLK